MRANVIMFEAVFQARYVGRVGLAARTGGSFIVAASLVFYLLLLVSSVGAAVTSTRLPPPMSGEGILFMMGLILGVPAVTFVCSLPTFLVSFGVFMICRRLDSPSFAVLWGGVSGLLFGGAAVVVLATHDLKSLGTSVSSESVFAAAVAALLVTLPVGLGASRWRQHRDA
jgi:hypothetical protein